MKYIVSTEIFKMFPHLRIGIIVGNNLKIKKYDEVLSELINNDILEFRKKFLDNNLLNSVNIEAWRETYRRIGVNPKKYRPTAESFLDRINKGKDFPNINTLVDLYLSVELKHMLPVGGYDLRNIVGNILLKPACGNEEFMPIGGTEIEITPQSELIYIDCRKVLTRRWNHRDCETSKITTRSKNVLLACEAALEQIDTYDLIKTMEDIREYAFRFCSGDYTIHYIDINKQEIEFN